MSNEVNEATSRDIADCLATSIDGNLAPALVVGEDLQPAVYTLLKRHDGLSIRIGDTGPACVTDLPLTRKDALMLANSILGYYSENDENIDA